VAISGLNNPNLVSTKNARSIPIEKKRNPFWYAAAENPIASRKKIIPIAPRITPMVLLLAASPICIGKNVFANALITAFPITINAMTRRIYFLSANLHTLNPVAIMSTSYIRLSGKTNSLVGEPTADRSPMDWEVKL